MSRIQSKVSSKPMLSKEAVNTPELVKETIEEECEEPANVQNTLQVGSLLRTWTEVSRINYFSSQPLDVVVSGDSIRRRAIGMPVKECSIQNFVPSELRNKSDEALFSEQFPVNVTPLLNEDQLWGCFYNFPELYGDVYSPVVRIRKLEDVAELVGGVLSRDMVTACLTYLKRTPILGDFVYIKLDLSAKLLTNIDVLQHYKYLVYLDLSSNLLTELTVLSHLLYLQFLSVASNRLETVLEYDTPQWFLTEVHYKMNSVTKIRDISEFWSITILDLSHNNIKVISGLENLRHLRRLDLSFNHIQCLENLNHLRLLWLDISYNNISSFEISHEAGLWTLYHLEYLNINENNLTSMKLFCGCTRLRELHARNNRFGELLELAVYMRQMRRLMVVDLRANPVCATPGYIEVVIDTFPMLLSLDAEVLDPEVQRAFKMEMNPHVPTFATRRLLRVLYIEQLSRARLSPSTPPADTTEVPLIVLVGYEAVGKGTLARRLAKECSANVELALQHTTSPYHFPGQYLVVTRAKFDDMLLDGEFLTYCEMDGESYGLSRKEAAVNEGKVKIVCMDLVSALMLKFRGLRPYLILVTQLDKRSLNFKQRERKSIRNIANEHRKTTESPLERSTLQVLLSGRIIITGILNEILLSLPEEKEKSEFLLESECSLMMDSETRQAVKEYATSFNFIQFLASKSSASLEDAFKRVRNTSPMDQSLYSLYKESHGNAEFTSFTDAQNSYQDRSITGTKPSGLKHASISHPKSSDLSHYTSSTFKGPGSTKSSKSVTFNSQDNVSIEPTGMLIEPQTTAEEDDDKKKPGRSVSAKLPQKTRARDSTSSSTTDLDLWLAFLIETGLLARTSAVQRASYIWARPEMHVDDPESIIKQLAYYQMERTETSATVNIRDEYEDIHRTCPGLFWDTVITDNIEEAFLKLKRIVQNIFNSQQMLKPLFDIDFTDLQYYPTVESRLNKICKQITPQRLFH